MKYTLKVDDLFAEFSLDKYAEESPQRDIIYKDSKIELIFYYKINAKVNPNRIKLNWKRGYFHRTLSDYGLYLSPFRESEVKSVKILMQNRYTRLLRYQRLDKRYAYAFLVKRPEDTIIC